MLGFVFACLSAQAEFILQVSPSDSPLAVTIGTDITLKFNLLDSETGKNFSISSSSGVQVLVDDTRVLVYGYSNLRGLQPGETVIHVIYAAVEPALQVDIPVTVSGTIRYEKLIITPSSEDQAGEPLSEGTYRHLEGYRLNLAVSALTNQGKTVAMNKFIDLEWNENVVRLTSGTFNTTNITFETLTTGQSRFHARLGDLLECELTVVVAGIEKLRFDADLQQLREFDRVSTVYAVYTGGKEMALSSYQVSSSNTDIVGITNNKIIAGRQKGECTLHLEYTGSMGETSAYDFPVRVIASVTGIEPDPAKFPYGIPIEEETAIRAMVKYDDGVTLSKEVSWTYDTALADLDWKDDHFILAGEKTGATVFSPYVSEHRTVQGPSVPVEFYIPIKSVTISPSTISLNLHDSTRVVMQVTRTDSPTETLLDNSWTQEPSLGFFEGPDFHATSVGTAALTGRFTERGQTYTAHATINIVDAIETLEILPSFVDMSAGETQSFDVTAVYASGKRESIQNDSKTKYTLSNSTVGTLSKNQFTAKTAGSCTLKVTYGDYSTNVLIAIDNPLKEITIQPSASFSTEVGEMIRCTATGVFADTTQLNMNGMAKWMSSDSSVAEFDENVLEILKAGSTTIQAAYQDIESEAIVVTIPRKMVSIDIEPEPFVSLSIGESEAFTAQAVYNDGSQEDITDQAEWSVHSFASAVEQNRNAIVALRGGTASMLARYEGRESMPVGIWVDRSLQTPEINLTESLKLTGQDFFGPDIAQVEVKGRWMLARVDEFGNFSIGKFYLPYGEAQTARVTASGWFNGGVAELDVPIRAQTSTGTYSPLVSRNGDVWCQNTVVRPGEFLTVVGTPSINPVWDTWITETGIRVWNAVGIFQINLPGSIDPSPSGGNFTMKTSSSSTTWNAPDFKSRVNTEPSGAPPLLTGSFSAKTYFSAFFNPQPSISRTPFGVSGSFLSNQGWGYTHAPYYIQPNDGDYLSLLADRDWAKIGDTIFVKAACHIPNAIEEIATLVFDFPKFVTVAEVPAGGKISGNLLTVPVTFTPTNGSTDKDVSIAFQVADGAGGPLDFFTYFQGTTYYSNPVRVNVEPSFVLTLKPANRSVAAGESTVLILTVESDAPLRSARVQISCPKWFKADLTQSSSGIEWNGNTAILKFSLPNSGPDTFTLAGTILRDTPATVTTLRFVAEGIGVKSKGETVIAEPQETSLFLTPLLLTLRAEEKKVNPGESIHYTLTATNGSNQDMTHLELAVDLPAQVTVQNAPSGGTVQNQTLSWTIAKLGSGDTTQQSFELNVDEDWSSLFDSLDINVRSRSPETTSEIEKTWVTKGAWGMVTTTWIDLYHVDDSYPAKEAIISVADKGNIVNATRSNESGIYELEGLLPGGYQLNTEKTFTGYGGEWMAKNTTEIAIPAMDISPQLRDQTIAIGPLLELFAPANDAEVSLPALSSEFSGAAIQGGIVHRFENQTVTFPGRGISFDRTLPGFPNLISQTLDLASRINLDDPQSLSSNRPLGRHILGLLALNEINQYNQKLILDVADGIVVVVDNLMKTIMLLENISAKSGEEPEIGDTSINPEVSAVLSQEINKRIAESIAKLAAADESELESFKRTLSLCLPLIKTPVILMAGKGGKAAVADLLQNISTEVAKIVLDDFIISSLAANNRNTLDGLRLTGYAATITGSHDSARREMVSLLRKNCFDSDMAHFNYETIKAAYDRDFTLFVEILADLLASESPDFAKFSMVLKGLRSGLVGAAAFNCLRQLNQNTQDSPAIAKTAFQPKGTGSYSAKKIRPAVGEATASTVPLQSLWDKSSTARQTLAASLAAQNTDSLKTDFSRFISALQPFEQYLDYILQELIDLKDLAGTGDERLEIETSADEYRYEKLALLAALMQCDTDSAAWQEALDAIDAFEKAARQVIEKVLRYVEDAPSAVNPDNLKVLAVQSYHVTEEPLTPKQTAWLAVEVINRGGKTANDVACEVDGFSDVLVTPQTSAMNLSSSQSGIFTFSVKLSEEAVNGPYELLITVYEGTQARTFCLVSGTVAGANDPDFTSVKGWKSY